MINQWSNSSYNRVSLQLIVTLVYIQLEEHYYTFKCCCYRGRRCSRILKTWRQTLHNGFIQTLCLSNFLLFDHSIVNWERKVASIVWKLSIFMPLYLTPWVSVNRLDIRVAFRNGLHFQNNQELSMSLL